MSQPETLSTLKTLNREMITRMLAIAIRLLTFVLVFFLVGCEYQTLSKTENYETRIIRWVKTDVMPPNCKKLETIDSKVIGCAIWNNTICTIYAPEPKHLEDVRKFEVLGHETLHCFNGKFH